MSGLGEESDWDVGSGWVNLWYLVLELLKKCIDVGLRVT